MTPLTPEERALLDELHERDRAELVADVARRDAMVAADRAKGRSWDDGPAGPPPSPPRIGRILGIGEHGEKIVEAAMTREELIEQNWERDPVDGHWQRSTWTDAYG